MKSPFEDLIPILLYYLFNKNIYIIEFIPAMARIISTFSLGVEEVKLLEAYSVRHKMKKSRIIGNLLNSFLVLETCTDCEIESLMDKKEYLYGNKKPQPAPATFGFHYHDSGCKKFQCINCSEISRDNIAQMQLDKKPLVKKMIKGTPSQKWEWTLINNLTANDLREYKAGHEASIQNFME